MVSFDEWRGSFDACPTRQRAPERLMRCKLGGASSETLFIQLNSNGEPTMSIYDLTIPDLTYRLDEMKNLAELCGSTTNGPREIPGHGRYVIVRSRDAGVQYGKLDRYTENGTVYLKDARQMWSWVAAEGGTLLDCATHGVKGGKFSTKAEAVIVLGACAIIDCTEKAVETLESVQWE